MSCKKEKHLEGRKNWLFGAAAVGGLVVAGVGFLWANGERSGDVVAENPVASEVAVPKVAGSTDTTTNEGDALLVGGSIPGFRTQVDQYKTKLSVCMKAKGFDMSVPPQTPQGYTLNNPIKRSYTVDYEEYAEALYGGDDAYPRMGGCVEEIASEKELEQMNAFILSEGDLEEESELTLAGSSERTKSCFVDAYNSALGKEHRYF